MKRCIIFLLVGLVLLASGCGSVTTTTVEETTTPTTATTTTTTGLNIPRNFFGIVEGYDGKAIYGPNWSAQVFTPASSYTVTKVRIPGWKVGSPGDVSVSIRDFSTNLTLAEAVTDSARFSSTDPGSYAEVELSVLLEGGKDYLLVVRTEGTSTENCLRWLFNIGPSSEGYYFSLDSGTTWNFFEGRHFHYEVWGVR